MSIAIETGLLARRAVRRFVPRQAIAMIRQTAGMLDYIRSPSRGAGWGPFNGQSARQALFIDIVVKTRPQMIVETGTFLGATTELMAQTGLPVFTMELDPRNCGFARARFLRSQNVKLFHGDSRACLLNLFDKALYRKCGSTVFFYLDAHWNDDLPLAEELDIVFHRCPMAIVMIDDFEVPGDSGYGFDDYGPGKALVSGYIRSAISAHRLVAFYPSTPSCADYPSTAMAAAGLARSGRLRRGCVVLAKEAFHGLALASMPLLRAASAADLEGRD